jgi:hypothetical protein
MNWNTHASLLEKENRGWRWVWFHDRALSMCKALGFVSNTTLEGKMRKKKEQFVITQHFECLLRILKT